MLKLSGWSFPIRGLMRDATPSRRRAAASPGRAGTRRGTRRRLGDRLTCFGTLSLALGATCNPALKPTNAPSSSGEEDRREHLIAGRECRHGGASSLYFSRPDQHERASLGRPLSLGESFFLFGQVRNSAAREKDPVGGRGDALAEMPSDEPRAQLAFKDSMIRGILQFTLRIAFRCVLHRCKSQDIRC